jgi:hypothetical protein
VTSPLPVGSLPTIGGGGSTSLSPGGDASGLFPTLNPSAVPTPLPNQGQGQGSSSEVARRVANSDAMPIGTPVIDAQLAGLAALGVAFMLAATRLSVRRRPALAAKQAAAADLAATSPEPKPAAAAADAPKPAEAPVSAETPTAVLSPAPAEPPPASDKPADQ